MIATKRKSLKKLALKRCARNVPARRMKNKYAGRQSKNRSTLRTCVRKPYDKKMRRLSVQVFVLRIFQIQKNIFLYEFNLILQSKYKKPVSHEQTSDSEVPLKIKKRRNQSQTTYRSFRRKAKTPLSSAASNTSTRVADKSDSSSDSSDDDDNNHDIRNGNIPSTSSHSQAPSILDVNIPSTSTGITANGKSFLFRIANNNTYDSDDDLSISDTNQPEYNSQLRVINSPPLHNNHNNNHAKNHYDVNDGASTSTQQQQRNSFYNSSLRHHHNHHENGRKKYRPQVDEHEHDFEDYASTNNSNSLLSSTESSSDADSTSYADYFGKKRKLNNGSSSICDDNGNDASNNNNNNNNINNSSSNAFASSSNFVINASATSSTNGYFGTPSNNKVKIADPDSGCPSSSSRDALSSRGSTTNSFDVIKKIETVKRNFRKNMQTSDDSD